MSRTLPLCLLASALLAADAPKKAEPPTKLTVSLTVSAMPEPRPALRYTLLPELKDMNPGNPVQGYLKCFMEQNHFFNDKTSVENREKWLVMPLKDLPLDQVRGYGGSATRQADRAARLDTPDWQILLELKSTSIELLLPDVQKMRSLAAALKVRFRAEVAEQRFEAAIRTAQTLLALARHLGEHPTVIGNLVGISIANLVPQLLDEMLQRPGCPNLYWALTDLPSPFIDLRKGMSGDRMFLATDFALFDRETPLGADAIRRALARFDLIVTLSGSGDEPAPKASTTLLAEAKDAAAVSAARKRVVAAGLSEARAKALPAIQIILLDQKNAYETTRDEDMKWVNAPWPRLEAAWAKRRKSSAPFERMVTHIDKVVSARTRLDQRIALLRHVEAVRLYAAAHGGKVPASLADIDVPLPADPVTDEPFAYEIEGKAAIIRGTAPRVGGKAAGLGVEYRVTIR
jgi:hypothetical protein